MKLALRIDDVKNARNFRQILGFMLAIRKQCIFKFTTDELNIISFDANNKASPLIWGSIGKINFSRFDVIAKDQVIVLELNIEPLFQILKNYEKTTTVSDLSIKLQRGEELKDKNSKSRPIFMLITYIEEITMTQEIAHSFSIPVILSRRHRSERLQMPPISNLKLLIDLNNTLTSFFQRVERYKAIDYINIVANKLGELKIEFQDDARRISIKWKNLLEVCTSSDLNKENEDTDSHHSMFENDNNDTCERVNEDLNMIKEVIVCVKSRWWNLASKLIDLCEVLQMVICDEGCVFNCPLNDEPSYSLLYYVPGKLLE